MDKKEKKKKEKRWSSIYRSEGRRCAWDSLKMKNRIDELHGAVHADSDKSFFVSFTQNRFLG